MTEDEFQQLVRDPDHGRDRIPRCLVAALARLPAVEALGDALELLSRFEGLPTLAGPPGRRRGSGRLRPWPTVPIAAVCGAATRGGLRRDADRRSPAPGRSL